MEQSEAEMKDDLAWWQEAFGETVRGWTFRYSATLYIDGCIVSVDRRAREWMMKQKASIRAEALEAAAQVVANLDLLSCDDDHQLGWCAAVATALQEIRTLTSRIPPDHIREMQRQVARELPAGRFVSPSPDDEAVSRLVAASEAPAGCDGLGEVRVRVSDLRGALNALREAGGGGRCVMSDLRTPAEARPGLHYENPLPTLAWPGDKPPRKWWGRDANGVVTLVYRSYGDYCDD